MLHLTWSFLSTLLRYEELYALDPTKTRATPKEQHDLIVEHLVAHLRELETEQIFNRIQIYQRDRSCKYDSKINAGLAVNILQNLLFGKWTMVEKSCSRMGKKN